MSAEISELQVSLALEKLVICGVVSRGMTGRFYAAAPSLSDLAPRIRLVMERYGELRGVDAAVLAVIPPILQVQSVDLRKATQIMNLACRQDPDLARMVGL